MRQRLWKKVSGQADIERALDQLQATLPNCRNVSIISSWFASSTAIANCEIRPGVERRVRNLRNGSWQVGRDIRNSAYVVSTDDDGRPNFGGTPSDESLIQAIRSIKARGLTVTLYPFILVDAPGFPWRGRMTGQASDVRSFFGEAALSDYSVGAGEDHYRASDTGFRNYILSHANLARRAGGVDRFIIGSEMIGLTTIRDGQNKFPAVSELADLAADVRTMLGPDTGLTYAADWSEYFGYHPQDGSGDVFFHLDELWSHPAIDAVGIDAYFPLSDWRDGAHVDGAIYNDVYDLDYLTGNVEGGEGYDWYYASQADRDAQIRSPITDWIYRYKDLRNWWSQEHRNIINGVAQTPTKWVPQSKPFWLTEIGCPAVDMGANQPNLFSDGKSVESNIPYYSKGSRDDMIQRRYLESLIGYWEQGELNPTSEIDERPMIDLSAISVWTWDARPFPDFPARTDVWSDGPNWQRGHWVSGRLGGVALQDVIAEICDDVGLDATDLSGVNGLVSGFIIDRPMRAKDALAPLVDGYDLVVSERAGQVSFATLSSLPVMLISAQDLLAQDSGPIQFTVDDNMSSLRDARLTFIDATRDYQIATISAQNELAETVRIAQMQAPILMDPAQAKSIVENRLARSEPSRRAARFSIPIQSAPSVGDLITLPQTDGVWQVVQIRTGLQADIDCIALPGRFTSTVVSGGIPAALSNPQWVSEPVALTFDLPGTEGLQVGALQDPFRVTELGFQSERVTLNTPIKIGALLTDLSIQPATQWDRQSHIEIYMPYGAGFSVPELDVLNGANRFALETSQGWEVIAAANITLIGEQTYRLHTLLRGLNNSDDMMVEVIPAGARIVKLDNGLGTLRVDDDFIGEILDISVSSAGRAGVSAMHQYRATHLRPLSVVHVQVTRLGEQTQLNWISRNLDNSDKIDPDAQVKIGWPGGELLVLGTQVLLPIRSGANTPVTITPINAIGGEGASQVIYI